MCRDVEGGFGGDTCGRATAGIKEQHRNEIVLTSFHAMGMIGPEFSST